MKTSMIVLAASVVFGAAAFGGSEGCGSSSSDPGDDTGPDSTPTVDDCTECLAQTCRAETARCVNDADCLSILFCIEAANDGGGCTRDSASANGRCLYEQLSACELTRECETDNAAGCSTACEDTVNPRCPNGVSDGSTPALLGFDGGTIIVSSAPDCPNGDTRGATACDTCAAASCGALSTACQMKGFNAISPDYSSPCNEYAACRTECRDTACEARCAVGYPTGKSASDAYDACLAASCASACGAAATGDAGMVADAGDAGIATDAGDASRAGDAASAPDAADGG